jgi:hypothetical protein
MLFTWPLGDVIFAQLACPLNDVIFCLCWEKLTYLSTYIGQTDQSGIVTNLFVHLSILALLVLYSCI